MKTRRSSVCPGMPSRFFTASAIVCLATFPLKAQEEKKSAPMPELREVLPGLYENGSIRIDKNARRLTFPGKVNMADGTLEYLICTPTGSTHESLLVTDVQPKDIHVAMLLLDAKGAGLLAPAPTAAPPEQINAEYLKNAPRLKGDAITIVVKWKDAAGKERTAPVEDWVANAATKKAAGRGPWIYTGSMFLEDKFLAQSDGAIASLVSNPAALINNPRKGSDNDQIWSVNVKAVPPVATALEIVIQFEATPEIAPK